MKEWNRIFSQLAMIAQFGLSLIMPLLLCLLVCYLLNAKCGVGEWVYLLGFFFGLGGSFTTAYKFYLTVMKKEERNKEKEKPKVSFNKHH